MTFKRFGAVILAVALMAGGLSGCSNNTDAEENTQNVESAVEKQAEETSTEETNESEDVVDAAEEAFDQYFVSAEWLESNMNNENLVIIDTRGQEAYDKGHIEGSVVVAWQGLSNMGVEFASDGWGALKEASAMSEALSALGLTSDHSVVVYADTQNGWGEDGRVKWTLEAAGIEDVKMLDGGLNAWKAAGYDLTKEATLVETSDFKVENMNLVESIDTNTLVAEYIDYKIIDTRDKDEFDGAQKFGEARGGHLPGATWIAYKDLINKDGTMKTVEELETLFAQAGLNKEDKIATYCTAGIRSAHFAEILQMLGYENAVNYDESFYVWANKPELKLGLVKKDYAYNYYSADHLKSALEANETFTLLDIQVAEEFEAHHIATALETNAYPVKSDEDKAKLEMQLEVLKSDSNPVVIVCPRGGGGAERTYQYLEANGIASNRLYILEGGQDKWPYENAVN